MFSPYQSASSRHARHVGLQAREPRLLAGAAKSIQPERIEESFPKTVIVKKIVEDQKTVTADMLGTVKNLG